MPEQDDWKESLKFWYKDQYPGEPPKKEVEWIISFISSLLSSQAHALKERMKACVPDKLVKTNIPISDIREGELRGWNWCREQSLSAIESIEI